MVGSRHTNAAVGIPHAQAGSGALLDELCLDRRYVSNGRVLPKAEQRLDEQLETIIDGEIIPRLKLLHEETERESQGAEEKTAAIELAEKVDAFAELVVRHDADVIMAYVSSLQQKGADLESLLLNLLAPAARKLGKMWEEDTIDFVDVTIGTSRLQEILHRINLPITEDAGTPGRRLLLLPTPTEQHTFGLLMVSEFFRREGWDVWGGTALASEEIVPLVQNQWFALVGFSLSCERLLDSLCSTIKFVRRFSKNRSVQIVVGGRIFAENDLVRDKVDADMVVADAREAVELAEKVFQSARKRSD
jgi:methanogenic corrinoid protein MtbC1